MINVYKKLSIATLIFAAVFWPALAHAEASLKDATEFWPPIFGVSLKITDSLLVLFTFALAVFTYFLWRSTSKLWSITVRLAEGAEQTAERQLRAYVTIEKASFSQPTKPNESWYIDLVIKNYGQTPAYSCIAKIEYKISLPEGGNPVFPLSINSNTQPNTCLAPGHQVILRVPIPEMSTGNTMWTWFSQGRNRTYLWGRIDYKDSFKEPRFVTFQMACPMEQTLSFANCFVGNDTD